MRRITSVGLASKWEINRKGQAVSAKEGEIENEEWKALQSKQKSEGNESEWASKKVLLMCVSVVMSPKGTTVMMGCEMLQVEERCRTTTTKRVESLSLFSSLESLQSQDCGLLYSWLLFLSPPQTWSTSPVFSGFGFLFVCVAGSLVQAFPAIQISQKKTLCNSVTVHLRSISCHGGENKREQIYIFIFIFAMNIHIYCLLLQRWCWCNTRLKDPPCSMWTRSMFWSFILHYSTRLSLWLSKEKSRLNSFIHHSLFGTTPDGGLGCLTTSEVWLHVCMYSVFIHTEREEDDGDEDEDEDEEQNVQAFNLILLDWNHGFSSPPKSFLKAGFCWFCQHYNSKRTEIPLPPICHHPLLIPLHYTTLVPGTFLLLRPGIVTPSERRCFRINGKMQHG